MANPNPKNPPKDASKSQPPMLDAEGNVSLVASDGASYTLRSPLGEDMEKVENAIGQSNSKIRGMCAALAVLSTPPCKTEDVLKWQFDKILEVAEGLKLFPSFAEDL